MKYDWRYLLCIVDIIRQIQAWQLLIQGYKYDWQKDAYGNVRWPNECVKSRVWVHPCVFDLICRWATDQQMLVKGWERRKEKQPEKVSNQCDNWWKLTSPSQIVEDIRSGFMWLTDICSSVYSSGLCRTRVMNMYHLTNIWRRRMCKCAPRYK